MAATLMLVAAVFAMPQLAFAAALHLTSKGRYVGNVYDPDGTRVELDDE